MAKIPNRTTAAVRKELGSKFKELTKKLTSNAIIEKLKTNPRTKNRGLVLFLCPTEPPRIIGSGKRMHGAAMVKIPASRAKNI
jgi:hypothetical protein